MKQKINVEYLKPFGPGILSGKLSDGLLNNFIKLSEDVIDKRMRSWNEALVGAIDDEWKIPELLYKDYGLDEFLDSAMIGYAQGMTEDVRKFDKNAIKALDINDIGHRVTRGDGWINYMTEGEYNPIHLHTGCSLSSIFFINDYTGDEPIAKSKDKASEDGHTTFVYASRNSGFQRKRDVRIHSITKKKELMKETYFDGIVERGHWTIEPKRGDFYIFPAYLYHMVYPFKGNKKRITASINYGLETITK